MHGRVIDVHMQRDKELARLVLLNPHATYPRLLQQLGGVALLDSPNLILCHGAFQSSSQ